MKTDTDNIFGNKGEWSEIYTLFKLLGDKRLFSGDANLELVEDFFYPIIKIIRNETGGDYEYEINGDLVIVTGRNEELRIPVKTFSEQAVKLLNHIKGSTGSFSLPDTEAFMKSVLCNTLKSKSTSKSDIRIVIHDTKINQTADLGFSIKSQLGGDSTLLNAGKTTNFIYAVKGFNEGDKNIDKINQIESKSKIKDRIVAIEKYGGRLSFLNLENDVFKNNLVLIDSLLPNILAEIVKCFYTSNLNNVRDLCDKITQQNPLDYDTQYLHSFYEYKLKRFLTDVALGMMPSKVWTGKYDATGGYLIVKENGDVLCYHIYNRNQFEDYLFHNTRLETASSNRHEFGKLFLENNRLFFKLNLQIRFMN